jgi:hypothetical protein
MAEQTEDLAELFSQVAVGSSNPFADETCY